MNKLNTFLGLVFSLALASPAQAVSSVMWDLNSDDVANSSMGLSLWWESLVLGG